MNHKLFVSVFGFVILFLIVIFSYGIWFASDPNEIPSTLISDPASQFEIESFGGKTISLKDYKGHLVILNFWASWCVPCRAEASVLERLFQENKDSGTVFIGIAFNDKRENSIKFIKKYGKTFLLGPDFDSGSIAINYGVTGVPETFLIDKKGTIVDKIIGAAKVNTIQEFIFQNQ